MNAGKKITFLALGCVGAVNIYGYIHTKETALKLLDLNFIGTQFGITIGCSLD